jgi:hypothetical protein
MKKETLLFGIFFSFIIVTGLHGATDELQHIDRRKLDIRTDYIVGSLWRNEMVRDDDVEEAFSAVSVRKKPSFASSDEGKQPDTMHSTQDAEVASFIEEFDEVTKEITKDRRKTEAQTTSLKDFIEKVRSRGARNNPIAVKYVLRTIAEKY